MLRTFVIPQVRQIQNSEKFQQDRAPHHWTRNVRAHLDETFPDAWTGIGGPTAWPAMSQTGFGLPEITPRDFFVGDISRKESISLLSMTNTTARSLSLCRLRHLAGQAMGPPLPIPSIRESCDHVRSDVPGPVRRGSVLLDYLEFVLFARLQMF